MSTTPQPLTVSNVEGIDIEMGQQVSVAHESGRECGNAQPDKQEAAPAEQEALHSGAEQDAAATEYPSAIRFRLAVATLCLGIFLITLVRQASSCTRWLAAGDRAKRRQGARWLGEYPPGVSAQSPSLPSLDYSSMLEFF